MQWGNYQTLVSAFFHFKIPNVWLDEIYDSLLSDQSMLSWHQFQPITNLMFRMLQGIYKKCTKLYEICEAQRYLSLAVLLAETLLLQSCVVYVCLVIKIVIPCRVKMLLFNLFSSVKQNRKITFISFASFSIWFDLLTL